MKVVNSNKYGELKLGVLEEFEQNLGTRLPHDYREFLIKHNGGKPTPNAYDIPNNGSSGLHHSYGLHEHNHADLREIKKTYCNRISDDLLPIFDDAFGNEICIGIGKENYNKVFFWMHDKPLGEDNFVKISDSFSEFLNKLYEYINQDETDIDKLFREKNLEGFKTLINSGYNIETLDKYNRNLLENAAIKAFNELILFLYKQGAKPRNSLELAKQNAEFFDTHKETVNLLKKLYSL